MERGLPQGPGAERAASTHLRGKLRAAARLGRKRAQGSSSLPLPDPKVRGWEGRGLNPVSKSRHTN